MEWSKTRLILILAFALLDVFLIYRVWFMPTGGTAVTTVSPKRIDQTVERLAEKGILVEASFDLSIPPVCLLTVSASPELSGLFERLRTTMPGTPHFEEGKPDPGASCYRSGAVELVRYASGRVTWTYSVTAGESESMIPGGVWDPVKAGEVAKDFIDRIGGLPSELKFDYVAFDKGTDSYLVTFTQWCRGRPIFGSGIRIRVAHWGVMGLEAFWLSVSQQEGEKRGVIRPTDALLAAESLIVRDSLPTGNVSPGQPVAVVEEVELGYYTAEYDARQWQISPAWRVRLKDSRVYLVDAYTGEVQVM